MMKGKIDIGRGHLVRAMQMEGFGHVEIMAMKDAMERYNFSGINFCSDCYTEDAPKGQKFYVVSTDVNGKEYLHHGGYVHTWDGHPYGELGYKTWGTARGVMTRLVKANDEWILQSQCGEHNRCTYRIEVVQI